MNGTTGRCTTPPSLLSDDDLWLFNEGKHAHLWNKLGAHPACVGGRQGCFFAVWAPEARRVHVIGDFNGWNHAADALQPRGSSGIWEAFVPGAAAGHAYRYRVASSHSGAETEKADPFAFRAEVPPKTASLVHDLAYEWSDHEWLQLRKHKNALSAPLSIYELHLGSWRSGPEGGDRALTYRELADLLPEYVESLGFTHVELMPVMEHPFAGSWGYQLTGYFAAMSRHGTPQELMGLIDTLHRRGIGVILDWVPSHFPTDPHGLAQFDGSHLYEHQDPREGFHPEWTSAIFNYGRPEVRAFLISSACFWCEVFHADGLRVDGVASMLYRDYSRRDGEWIANAHGGRENLEAAAFLRELNEAVHRWHPDVQTIAEDSSTWPLVTRPVSAGGLGFGLKWDMGWMQDTLRYLRREPAQRSQHHNELTFRSLYAPSESYVLPLSHDEVVHGKGSLLGKMPGEPWQQLANLRALYAYMFAQAGKKLLFMGAELAQRDEWDWRRGLDWHLLRQEGHAGMRRLLADLNRLYRAEPALHELDCAEGGFTWIACDDEARSVFVIQRNAKSSARPVLAVLNLTSATHDAYRIGVPKGGTWDVLLSTDARAYGGTQASGSTSYAATPIACNGLGHSVELTLPPLSALFVAPASERSNEAC